MKKWEDALNRETKWSTYEANVQAYRSNMIASQSFLLAVGALLLEKSFVLLSVCVAVAMIQLWYIWFRVIWARTKIVDYYKFDLRNRYDAQGKPAENAEDFLDEDTFIHNAKVRNHVYENLGMYKKKLKQKFRTTRFKLDVLIPVSFSVIWLGMLVVRFFGI
ncbi:MAG: hypothetical protein IKJ51_00750 [Clostridia bacterium]|nr:hypothetical protein [Clostridia bacterium]MBR6808976.1 hypothetical protein [Clostridia bacterium]